MKFTQSAFWLILLSIALMLPGNLPAQSALDDNDQATVAFDLDLARVKNSEMVKGIGINAFHDLLNELQDENPIDDLELKHAKRIRGAVSLPRSIDVFEQMDRGQAVLEFMVEVEFENEDAIKEFAREIKSEFTKQEVGGNRDYYKPMRAPATLQKIGVEFASGNRIMIGTDKYFEAGLNNVNTARLSQAWKAMPVHAFRAAIDLEGSSELIGQIVNEIKENAPGDMAVTIAGYVDLIQNAHDLALSADVSSNNLITLSANAVGEKEADDLQQGLDSLLALAKFSGRSWGKMAEKEEPEISKLLIGFFDSLKATRNGRVVSIKIPKPENMDEMVGLMANKARVAAARVEEMNDLRQIVLAMLNYESAHRKFPDESVNGSENISWRVRILPFLEFNALYDEMDVQEGWDSEKNRKAADKMPRDFGVDGKNSTVVWVVPEQGRPTGFAQIRDGSSNTIALIRIKNGVPWTQVKDITAVDAVKYVKGLKDGETVVVAMYDGSIHRIGNEIEAETLENLFNHQDGNVVEWGWDDK